MIPLRMNKSTIGFQILETQKEEMDDIFREPSKVGNKVVGKKYSETIFIEDIAQIRNYKVAAVDSSDADNINLKSKVRLVFSYDDFHYIKNELLINLKKGDLVVFMGGEESNLIIREITPNSFLNGRPLLYFAELEDHTRPIGGIK